jgi:tetratricopeptide (TPR) repeat protein
MRNHTVLFLLSLSLAACGAATRPAPPSVATAPTFEGLDAHSRPVTTSSPTAQKYFDQGLNLLFAFNHDEAIRSFRQATELDPNCAMAYWGVAIANGPHINNPVVPPEREKAAWDAVRAARQRATTATDVERALIEAAAARYADPAPSDRKALDEAYAAAMHDVWQRFPGDADVGALYAEAMMDLRPWDLWTADGSPQPGTDVVVDTLETVLSAHPNHPLALHLYIHAVEASPHPEKADAAADRLRDLQPGLGHLVHMPSHIDVRRGRWDEAVLANAKAMAADRRYRARVPEQGFYGLYIAHNHHMLAYAAMMSGRSAEALRAIDALVAGMPPEWMQEFPMIADGYLAMPLEVRMRFGLWDQILAAPEPAPQFPIARAMRHYARGVAYAAQNRIAEARAEQQAFTDTAAAVPSTAFFGNNTAADLLSVAREMLDGEIQFSAGQVNAGIAALHRGVAQENRLRYAEPPDWIIPVRDALGAALLKARRYREAEAVYRDGLQHIPNSGWALFGLARSLRLQGKTSEAATVEARYRKVWSKADVQITSSCLCQPDT